ncbi:MAG: hypothetical protein EOO34_00765 [Cyanobacteriota bacterium]|nr:MAG: hypothetical protein EOO34_00765 [Cyanobacteriota bacterium]
MIEAGIFKENVSTTKFLLILAALTSPFNTTFLTSPKVMSGVMMSEMLVPMASPVFDRAYKPKVCLPDKIFPERKYLICFRFIQIC